MGGGVSSVSFRIAAGVAILGLVAGGCSTGSSTDVETPTASARRLVATVDVGGSLKDIAATDTAVWVTRSGYDNREVSEWDKVWRIDPATNKIVATIQVGTRGLDTNGSWGHIAATKDAVWITGPRSVRRVDPATNKVVAKLEVGAYLSSFKDIAATDTDVWVAGKSGYDDDAVYRIDVAKNKLAGVYTDVCTSDSAVGVAATDTAVWVTCGSVYGSKSPEVKRIDPVKNQDAALIKLDGTPEGISATDTAVWVTSSGDDHRVWRIAPSTNTLVYSGDTESRPRGVAATDRAGWVSSGSHVLELDVTGYAVTATVDVGREADALSATENAVWVNSDSDGIVSRIDPR